MNTKDIQVIVLAGGKGKRMETEMPKVLVPLHGKPMISHLLSAVKEALPDHTPVIVTGYGSDQVMENLGKKNVYAYQAEQKGTAHAVQVAKTAVSPNVDSIMVLYGDHPNISKDTIIRIIEMHISSGSVLTMGTVGLSDYSDWKSVFYDFGRVVRDEKGNVLRIVEKKDATSEELAIQEVSPSYFCFKAVWLWNSLEMVGNDNNQHEYYLTDLIGLAIMQNQKVTTVSLPAEEALGANTPEQLKFLEQKMSPRLSLVEVAD